MSHSPLCFSERSHIVFQHDESPSALGTAGNCAEQLDGRDSRLRKLSHVFTLMTSMLLHSESQVLNLALPGTAEPLESHPLSVLRECGCFSFPFALPCFCHSIPSQHGPTAPAFFLSRMFFSSSLDTSRSPQSCQQRLTYLFAVPSLKS